MNKQAIINQMIGDRLNRPVSDEASAYAPVNIALCKYWGKRNTELNLPVTDSLSIALPNKGSKAYMKLSEDSQDHIFLNGKELLPGDSFVIRLLDFINLFRDPKKYSFVFKLESNVPIGAGLASSASGFASLVLMLDQFFGWQLTPVQKSILARLGSGSACRSIYSEGFAYWHAGFSDDGMDSFATPIVTNWEDLRVGLLIVSSEKKPISSREAMQCTVETSSFYQAWPQKVMNDLDLLQKAINEKDFESFGQTIESNALAMHATMLTAWPPISYYQPETIAMIHKVWQLRADGVPVYFTQDAGPNLKLFFLADQSMLVQACFPGIDLISPFA